MSYKKWRRSADRRLDRQIAYQQKMIQREINRDSSQSGVRTRKQQEQAVIAARRANKRVRYWIAYALKAAAGVLLACVLATIALGMVIAIQVARISK